MRRINREIREHTWDSLESYLNAVLSKTRNDTVRNFIVEHPISFLLLRISRLEKENRKLIRKAYE